MPMEVLSISSGNEPNSVSGFSFNQDGTYNIFGKSKIKISAIICDENKNVLFNLDELVETCYNKLQTLASNYDCR